MKDPSGRHRHVPLLTSITALLIVLLTACVPPQPPLKPMATATPTPTPASTTPPAAPTPTLEADASPIPPVPGRLAVHFMDVGLGDASLLQGPDFTVLIDAGRHDRNDVVPYLETVGVESIDLLIGTHPHANHIGQFTQVLEAFTVTEVWLSGDSHTSPAFEQASDAIETSGAVYHEPRAGEIVSIGSGRFEVVNPQHLTGNFHEGSVSVRVIYGNVAFMFTGDAGRRTEQAMVRREHELSAQVLQLGHHGSHTSTSSDFLAAVQPEVAVYSATSDESHSLPHDETVDHLAAADIPVYGTDTHGTVVVVTDGLTYEVRPERRDAPRPPSLGTPPAILSNE